MKEVIDVSARQLEAFKRFLSLLPHGKERDLVILKGHLLIEEQLRRLIDERVQNPKALSERRIDFSHCVSLAKAFFPEGHDPALWKGLAELNALRNLLAHQIEPNDIQSKMAKISGILHPDTEFSPDHDVNFEFTLW